MAVNEAQNRRKAVIGVVTMLMIGTPYVWGMFAPELEAELLWPRSRTSLVFTISIVSMILGGITSGYITGRMSSRAVLRISGPMVLVGYGLAARTEHQLLFFLFYAVLASVGLGMAYNAVMTAFSSCVSNQNRRGTFVGILLMAYAFCSVLFSPLIGLLTAKINWRYVFFGVGLISALWIEIAGCFAGGAYKTAPEPAERAEASKAPEPADNTRNVPPAEMICGKTARLYLLWGTFAASGGLSMIGQAPQIMTEVRAEPAVAALCASCIALANGLSRFGAGVLWDRWGWRAVMRLATGFNIAGTVCVLAGIYGGALAAVFLGACLAAVSYGFGTPIGASFVRKFFGERYYAINYSLINLVGLSASLCGPTVVGTLRTHTGSYVLPTAVLLLYSLLAVPVLECLKEEKG